MIPMQDILSLGQGHRINTPGTIGHNWRWRFHWCQIDDGLVQHLKTVLCYYDRSC